MKYVEDHDIKQRVEYNANAALEKTKNIGKSLWARAKTLTLKGKKTEEEKSTDDNSQDQIQSIEAEQNNAEENQKENSEQQQEEVENE